MKSLIIEGPKPAEMTCDPEKWFTPEDREELYDLLSQCRFDETQARTFMELYVDAFKLFGAPPKKFEIGDRDVAVIRAWASEYLFDDTYTSASTVDLPLTEDFALLSLFSVCAGIGDRLTSLLPEPENWRDTILRDLDSGGLSPIGKLRIVAELFLWNPDFKNKLPLTKEFKQEALKNIEMMRQSRDKDVYGFLIADLAFLKILYPDITPEELHFTPADLQKIRFDTRYEINESPYFALNAAARVILARDVRYTGNSLTFSDKPLQRVEEPTPVPETLNF